MMKTPTFYCLATPTLSLGEDTARLNLKLSSSHIGRKNQATWPNNTDNSKRNTKISNHAYKNLEKTQIIFIDNLIISPQFIGSRQTHRKRILHRIELQEHQGEHCIGDQRERRSHL